MWVRFLFLFVLVYFNSGLDAKVGLLQSRSEKSVSTAQKPVILNERSGEADKALKRKTFPMRHWAKHYSSLGRQKSAVSTQQTVARELYATQTLTFPVQQKALADMNGRLAALQQRAQMSIDDRLTAIEEQRVYAMMLQGTQQYGAMREKISLRELNRIQFRRNR